MGMMSQNFYALTLKVILPLPQLRREPASTASWQRGALIRASHQGEGFFPPLGGEPGLANAWGTPHSQLSRPMPSRHLIYMESRLRRIPQGLEQPQSSPEGPRAEQPQSRQPKAQRSPRGAPAAPEEPRAARDPRGAPSSPRGAPEQQPRAAAQSSSPEEPQSSPEEPQSSSPEQPESADEKS